MDVMNRYCLGVVLWVFWAGWAMDADARSKTDRVVFNNGDVLHGEIKKLERGLLRYSTDSMGTVEIEWDDVRSVESSFRFRVRLEDGKRYFGSLAESESDGHLQLATRNGPVDVPLRELVAATPIETALLDRLDAYLNAGYDYTKASNVSRFNLGAEISYETDYTINTLMAESIITEDRDKTTRSAAVDLSRRAWLADVRRTFRTFFTKYETNDELALHYRVSAGGGFGAYVFNTNKVGLSGIAGLQVLSEEDTERRSTHSVEGIFTTTFERWRYDSPKFDVQTQLTLYPGITEAGRLRGDFDVRLRWELFADFFWDVSTFVKYDNEVAQEGSQVDYGVTTGLGWEI